MTATMRMNDDFLDTLLTDCEPTTANDLGFSPFEFPVSKDNSAYTSPTITPTIVLPTMSPKTKTSSNLLIIPEMKLERAASPDSSAQHPGSPMMVIPTKRAFDDIIDSSDMSSDVLKVTLDANGNPPTKKRKQEDRRERKNQREKQRRTELNALFDNMVDLLGLPKETKADKVTVLASAINTIRQLRSTSSPELLELVQERTAVNVPVETTCEAAQQAVQKQQPVVEQLPAPSQPVLQAQVPAYHEQMMYQPATPVLSAPMPSVEDLTYFDPGSVFADM